MGRDPQAFGSVYRDMPQGNGRPPPNSGTGGMRRERKLRETKAISRGAAAEMRRCGRKPRAAKVGRRSRVSEPVIFCELPKWRSFCWTPVNYQRGKFSDPCRMFLQIDGPRIRRGMDMSQVPIHSDLPAREVLWQQVSAQKCPTNLTSPNICLCLLVGTIC